MPTIYAKLKVEIAVEVDEVPENLQSFLADHIQFDGGRVSFLLPDDTHEVDAEFYPDSVYFPEQCITVTGQSEDEDWSEEEDDSDFDESDPPDRDDYDSTNRYNTPLDQWDDEHEIDDMERDARDHAGDS